MRGGEGGEGGGEGKGERRGGVMFHILPLQGVCSGGLTSMSFSSPLQPQPWSELWHKTLTLEISLRLAISG